MRRGVLRWLSRPSRRWPRGPEPHLHGPDTLWDVRLNGAPASEARFNAALAGQYGVPVALVTGDDVICDETRSWLPKVETAVVKYAIDRYTARCLAQVTALERIRAAAARAVQRVPRCRRLR